ncbi:succinyldiaminopimelate transaminase [Gordonia hongkongensis]|uniref:Succinyldiaminopimelate transaminase n=1 Tax=Gordonia hongkongensis TaxID=1701090 RepID=A0AAX3T3L8_9ACTN|nr:MULTISPECIES: succinyldiaminopimelate transaminase [Gordonia]OCW84852.1 succinyldiaminopimelate transaminase [Nocardia farcinica]QIK47267.1 succinyldiaminopimelate transaminase [Gordonia terrae]MDF6101561.1 succinyldiaminopimelate transaminase [Gordonia hongkongensis]WFP23699.1 succinyldiaminopimelate transaminase [Gordonia hongkongensis]WGJ84397.1 succinyldiaminopimelate transaminase [Gordonia sp. SMJS1]
MSSPVSRTAAPLRVSSTRVSGRLPDFPWDTIADAKATAQAHADGIVDLSVGTPVDPVPALIRDALAENSAFPGYPTTIGTRELREAAAESLIRRHGVTSLDETGILPVIGTKEAIAGLASTFGLGPGDDVVIPEVAYPTYEVSALLAGARAVRADSTVALGPMNPALMFINSPSNPTGKVLGLDHLRKVVGWARERGTVVVSDECYLGLSWEGEPLSILDPRVCDGDHTGLLAVHSLSKISNLASYRAGFFAGDTELIAELLAVRKHAGLIVPFPVQGAMTAALADDAHVHEQRERYAARRRLLKAAVEGAGFRVDHSEAGLYLWATRDEPCRETVAWLADRGILCAPGDFYGPAGERHVRMALTATDERIGAAVARLTA